MSDSAASDLKEMDQVHRDRVCRLLMETGYTPGFAGQAAFLSAYNAVLSKDILWTLNELLIYKQNEAHQ
jgi:hypothetical protein